MNDNFSTNTFCDSVLINAVSVTHFFTNSFYLNMVQIAKLNYTPINLVWIPLSCNGMPFFCLTSFTHVCQTMDISSCVTLFRVFLDCRSTSLSTWEFADVVWWCTQKQRELFHSILLVLFLLLAPLMIVYVIFNNVASLVSLLVLCDVYNENKGDKYRKWW